MPLEARDRLCPNQWRENGPKEMQGNITKGMHCTNTRDAAVRTGSLNMRALPAARHSGPARTGRSGRRPPRRRRRGGCRCPHTAPCAGAHEVCWQPEARCITGPTSTITGAWDAITEIQCLGRNNGNSVPQATCAGGRRQCLGHADGEWSWPTSCSKCVSQRLMRHGAEHVQHGQAHQLGCERSNGCHQEPPKKRDIRDDSNSLGQRC